MELRRNAVRVEKELTGRLAQQRETIAIDVGHTGICYSGQDSEQRRVGIRHQDSMWTVILSLYRSVRGSKARNGVGVVER